VLRARHAGDRRRRDRPSDRRRSRPSALVTGARLGAPPPAHGGAHRAAPAVGRAARPREAPTASARLGETALTIDVARDRIPEAELAAAEDLANDLVDDDLAIRAWFPDADELAAIKLRRDPKVTESIRVVAIGDFDYSPCGGTHCSRTSQIGAVRITNAERYKGMTRVTFAAARRGRVDLFGRDHVLRGLASQFSCGPSEVPAAIDKLRRDADAAGTELTAVRGRLAGIVASSFTGTGTVVAALPGDAAMLRGVASKLAASGRDAILCAPTTAPPSRSSAPTARSRLRRAVEAPPTGQERRRGSGIEEGRMAHPHLPRPSRLHRQVQTQVEPV
jgi:hypothetical protein